MATQGTNDKGSVIYKNRGNNSNYGKGRYANNSPTKFRADQRERKSYNDSPRFSGKDEEDEDKGRRSKPSRPKESKSGISIPDKDKAMLRLEKEQKSIKKKQQNKKKESNRPQPKVKRANNINYIRSYANGDYDDFDYE